MNVEFKWKKNLYAKENGERKRLRADLNISDIYGSE